MKKILVIVLALVLVLSFAACEKKQKNPTATPTVEATTEPTATPTATPDAPDVKGEGVMTHAQYVAAADEDEVVIECYVQDHQSWWEDKISVYAADTEGGYFLYNLACSEADAAKLVPGTKIRVKGYRATWAEEIEVAEGATFEILEGNYIAPVTDVTNLLGTSDLIGKQNLPVAFKGLTVVSAATYKWDNSGNPGDDLYFKVALDDQVFTFTVESYLRGKDTDVYKAVEALKVGDIVDLEGFLYWYNGANPHITKATVVGNVNVKSDGVMTWAQYIAAEADDEVTIECYVQDHQAWWEDKISVYAADLDGAYFIYNMKCSEEDAKKLTPGTKIRVKGYRAVWAGEIEVAEGAEFEILEGSYIAPAVDLTPFFEKDEILSQIPEVAALMNHLVTVKGLKVTGDPMYKYDGSGTRGDDIYFRVSLNGKSFSLVVESYLRDADSEVYKAVENLKQGDIIDVDAFLYWYNGANPHVVKVTVQTAE
ncbi:MAG: hypothetical protein J5648_09010 [Lachnospiraceae bacterium]|nr:hypothetical protein [Lachnospiraceae bacterium]